MAAISGSKEASKLISTSSAPPALPRPMAFSVACAAGVSGWLLVHPADTVKVRMQLMSSAAGAGDMGMLGVARGIYTKEGIQGLYSGLSAAIARQMTYTTMRLGFFDEIKAQIKQRGVQESFVTRAVTGMSAGALASFLACPVEVCLVRMQADGRLPLEKQRGYRNVFDALWRVGNEEGVLTYWRGAGPTVLRAMVVSCTQLGTYDQAKASYKEMGVPDGLPLQLSSSLTAGLVYSLASLPLDTAKTRMQTQMSGEGGQLRYKSTGQTLLKIIKDEGPLRLWKGFSAYFVRGGGHTVAMLIFYEQYKATAQRWLQQRQAHD